MNIFYLNQKALKPNMEKELGYQRNCPEMKYMHWEGRYTN